MGIHTHTLKRGDPITRDTMDKAYEASNGSWEKWRTKEGPLRQDPVTAARWGAECAGWRLSSPTKRPHGDRMGPRNNVSTAPQSNVPPGLEMASRCHCMGGARGKRRRRPGKTTRVAGLRSATARFCNQRSTQNRLQAKAATHAAHSRDGKSMAAPRRMPRMRGGRFTQGSSWRLK